MRSYKQKIQAIFFLILAVPGSHGATPSCNSETQLCNVQVLIEQYSVPTSDYPALLSRTPSLQQLHLRVSGPVATTPPSSYSGSDIANQTAQAILQIASAAPSVTIGYHPDISKSSYQSWGCTSDPNPPACSFKNSIALMNAINQQLPGSSKIKIYSIEQSYPIPQGAADVMLQKNCLTGTAASPYCDTSTVANPSVLYGYVSPSCGDPALYGTYYFDYGYPQMYGTFGPNNGRANYTYSASTPNALPLSAYPGNQFPANGAGFILIDSLGSPNPYSTSIPGVPVIPSQLTSFTNGDIHSIYEIFTSPPVLPTVEAAAQTLATMVADKYGNPTQAPFAYPCGPTTGSNASRYFTFSGEPQFFGSSGWTVASENAFISDLQGDLQAINAVSAANVASMQFAIWSFDTMTGTGNLMDTSTSINTPEVLRGPKTQVFVSTKMGGGLVTSKPKGIVCGRRCTHGFQAKKSITLTATPAPGYRFVKWGGNCRGKSGKTCTLRVNRPRTVSAEFTPH